MTGSFLTRPGESGMFGALMDEYARAAEDFCRVVESIPPERFVAIRASDDPDTVSMQAVCAHAVSAAHRYSDYIRHAREGTQGEPYVLPPDRLREPADVRGLLRDALQETERTLHGLYEAPEQVASLTFQVRWGATYDPEMILEHAIVHLLRHRRQLERWTAGTH